jgi:hypothetical protein
MKPLLATFLLCSSALAQSTPAKKLDAPNVPDSFAVEVSTVTWESGELKTCSTYFHHPKFLLCDDDVRAEILFRPADANKIIRTASTKRFLVHFSKLPWRLALPDPNKQTGEPPPVFAEPDSKSRDMETRWDCSKEKMITCNLIQSF